MSALLNYKLEGSGETVVLIHGLFGSLDNLGLLARDLKNDHQVLSLICVTTGYPSTVMSTITR